MTEPTCAISVEDFKDKYVKLFFKNSSVCEGIAAEWTDDHIILLGKGNDNILYIYNPKENIVMVKVFVANEQPPEEQHYKDPVQRHQAMNLNEQPVEQEPIVEPDPPKLDHHKSDQALRMKKIAELKKEQANLLKEKFNKRVKTFSSTQLPIGHYGTPNFKK